MRTKRVGIVLAAALMCSAGVVLNASGGAVAQEADATAGAKKKVVKKGPPGPPGPPGPVAEWAGVVSSAGALVRGKGIATVARTAAGQYAVTFERDVSVCFPLATIHGGTSGAIRVNQAPAQPNIVTVSTRSEGTAAVDPTFADRAFVIVVACPETTGP